MFGEVAPSLRFRTDAVSYSSGLAKLKNMYVKRSGGVSNRAGTTIQHNFENVYLVPGEDDVYFTSEQILDFKFFSYTSPSGDTVRLSCIKTLTSGNLLYQNGNLVSIVQYQNIETASILINFPDPSIIKFTYTKDGIFIAPYSSFSGSEPAISDANVMLSFDGKAILLHKDPQLNVAADVVYGASGRPPFLPASYLITAILKDGTEETVSYRGNGSYDPSTWNVDTLGTKVVLPTAEINTYFKLTFSAPSTKLSQVKFFNLYRSSNAIGGRNAFYKLVSRSFYDGSTLEIIFNDYGAESFAETPLLDNGYYGAAFLQDAVDAVYYQQRLILSFNSYANKLKSGEVLVSKIGAPKQFISPLIFNDSGPFVFSIPIQDGGQIVGWLSMDRLVVFTTKAVYVVRGGEQGILTPTTVNPLRISEEGCSSTVAPKMSNRRGYFINSRGSKLMSVQFADDGNLSVFEASLFSEHLFDNDVKEIEVLSGFEDTVYVLKTDGTLVRVTCTDEGTHGFSTVQTNGKILHIFKENNYLFAVIERNGVKFLERFEDRLEKKNQFGVFSDLTFQYGLYLSKNKFGGYSRAGYLSQYPGEFDILANIETLVPDQWGAGTQMKLKLSGPIQSLMGSQNFQLHFYYEDENNNPAVLRFIAFENSESASSDPSWSKELLGYFTSDVPEYFKNVEGQSITPEEKLNRYSRFVLAIDTITNLNVSALEYLHNAMGGGDSNYPISVVADEYTVSSPNNPFSPSINLQKTGSDYKIELDDFYGFIQFGIPYDCEFETLDLETGGSRTLTDTRKIINAVGLGLMETRGGFAGMPEQTLQNMEPIVTRQDESLNVQTPNFNGHIVVHVPAEYSEPGRVNIKHVDPSPISILSVYPKGLAGD